MKLDEVISIIEQSQNSSFDEILNQSNIETYELQEILREAELLGMIMRKTKNNKTTYKT